MQAPICATEKSLRGRGAVVDDAGFRCVARQLRLWLGARLNVRVRQVALEAGSMEKWRDLLVTGGINGKERRFVGVMSVMWSAVAREVQDAQYSSE